MVLRWQGYDADSIRMATVRRSAQATPVKGARSDAAGHGFRRVWIYRPASGRTSRQNGSLSIGSRRAIRSIGPEPLRQARVQHIEADILDDEGVRAAIQGADTVINLVGILSQAGPQTFTAIHEDGARRVAATRQALGRHATRSHVGAGGQPHRTSAGGPLQGGRRRGGARRFPRGDDHPAQLGLWTRRSLFQRLRRAGATAAGVAADWRRPNEVSARLCRGRRHGLAAILANPASRGNTYEFGGPGSIPSKICSRLSVPRSAPDHCWCPYRSGPPKCWAGCCKCFPMRRFTRDQVRLLRTHKVVSGSEPTLGDLGVKPQALETIVPEYLAAYRQGGRG